jgi:hypothetical protein
VLAESLKDRLEQIAEAWGIRITQTEISETTRA